MAEKITSINPSMLVWAREVSGTTVEYVGERMGGIDTIRLWEKGEDFPTYSQLKELCKIYRKPVVVCFFPEPPKLKNTAASYRTLPYSVYNSFSRKLFNVIDNARVMQLNLFELHNNINPCPIKFTDIKFNYKNVKIVASQLRQLLGVDLKYQKKINKIEDAFEIWRDAFYNKLGIYVFKEAFQDDTVSGFCLYDEEFPIIYINNSFAPSRQVFTLFHEIYHLICRTSGVDFLKDRFLRNYNNPENLFIERTCNCFAGRFLVPDQDFEATIKDLKPNSENISRLSKLYCVSREVILRKFLDSDLIDEDFYREKRDEYNSDYFREKAKSKESSGGDYYNTQMAYKGKNYVNLVYGQYYKSKITVFELAKYMNMKIPSVKTLALKKGWRDII